MNVQKIPVRIVELVWMGSMDTVLPVFHAALDLTVKQVSVVNMNISNVHLHDVSYKINYKLKAHRIIRQLFFLKDVNEGVEDPCKNGGIFLDGINAYSCTCDSGYSGFHCETGRLTILILCEYI